jgi:restriction system protein
MKYIIVYFLIIVLVAFINVYGSPSRRKKRKKRLQPTKKKSNAKQPTSSKKLTDEQILQANIDDLSGTDFEKLMSMYYRDKGYNVQIIGGSGDHEVDLILKGKEGYKIAVQCKRWKNSVGNDIVLRLKSGKQVHGCYDAWIVTTSHFTRAAQEAAERLNIRLINGAQTHDMIARWKKEMEPIPVRSRR